MSKPTLNGGLVIGTMTVRDIFAAIALPSAVKAVNDAVFLPTGMSKADCMAAAAYEVADAMLAQKAKGEV